MRFPIGTTNPGVYATPYPAPPPTPPNPTPSPELSVQVIPSEECRMVLLVSFLYKNKNKIFYLFSINPVFFD